MNPKISILVPIYGIEKYIGYCVESLINQSYKNIEIILVDDGSPDNSGKIIDSYAAKDSRIKVIHKKNGGLVSARKAGLKASSGSLISYVDGDDWVEPDFIEVLYKCHQETNAEIIVAGHSRDFFEATEKFTSNMPSGFYAGEKLLDLKTKMLSCGDFYKPGISTYLWNKLFKREVIYDAQMRVDERISIGEDAAVVYPAIEKAHSLAVIDNTSYHYRQREDSMLKKRSKFATELKKLKILYDYMSSFPYKSQINDFILGKCIMLSGNNIPNKDVVIYGAGSYGQQLVFSIEDRGLCNVVAWLDDDYLDYRKAGLDVIAVEDVLDKNYNYLYIASIDVDVVASVKQRLTNLGVPEEKILSVAVPKTAFERANKIQEYFNITGPETVLTFIGQAGFEIKSKSGQTLGIDYYLSDCVERIEPDHEGFKRLLPAPIKPKDIKTDILIATHAHGDHYDFDAIPIILDNGHTKLYASESCPQGIKVKAGDVITEGDFKITFVNCDHGDAAPDAVGVLVDVDGKRILEVGDSCLRLDRVREYLQNGPIDILIGPINGAYGNMTEEDFEKLTDAINPKLAIPCHAGLFKAHGGNAERVPKIGEKFTV